MKPEYIKHTDIDFVKWDNCVEQSNNHLPYCYSWYLNIVSPGWDSLISGDYKKIFPLTFKTKAGINYLYQPFFTQQLGLFGKNITESDCTDFLKAIPEKFKFIEINLNSNSIVNEKEIAVKYRTTHHLNLNEKYTSLYKAYNENTKRNFKKSEKLKLQFNENGNIKKLLKLFKESVGKKTVLKNKNYKVLERLMTISINNKTGKIVEARDAENNLLASLFLISSQNILINLFNASSSLGKKKSAMFFLFNEIIKRHEKSNFTLDFEGSEIAEVARFYKGFGGVPVFYPHIKLNRLHWSLKWLKK